MPVSPLTIEVEIEWISSEDLEKGRNLQRLETVDGIVVPGGFGYRGIEGKIVAAKYAARTQGSLSRALFGDASHVHRACTPNLPDR